MEDNYQPPVEPVGDDQGDELAEEVGGPVRWMEPPDNIHVGTMGGTFIVREVHSIRESISLRTRVIMDKGNLISPGIECPKTSSSK